ncbi:PREDICTED: cysteine-rich repeat secretory protein 18-like [Camelina sativa]|uniref:Cysteine-rich repeat secretory protein 18-like n=1 Tax=Camelina sativa TaxID=90675 RepID=A0ABM0W6P4_CAMSA|nr:PREDICTED: cysteine-rich repeat secretory protein 18-like [Camelina sativa]
MYSSSSLSKRLFLVTILAVVATQLFLMRTVSSLNMTNAYLHHKCLVSQGKYKPGSLHDINYNKIIKSLSNDTYAFRTGYSMTALGEQSDLASVTFQCRGDSYGNKCRSCFATAQSELRKKCPRDKGAIIWYDQCFVEFSSFDTTGQINYDDGFCMTSAKNVSGDRISFEKTFLVLVGEMTQVAVTKKQKIIKNYDKPAMYAAGEKRLGKKKLYVMVQCMVDLNEKGCRECLSHMVVHYQDCYRDKQGARVFGGSCSFRFELYPFVNPKTSPN